MHQNSAVHTRNRKALVLKQTRSVSGYFGASASRYSQVQTLEISASSQDN